MKNRNMFRLTVNLFVKKVAGTPFKNTFTYNNVMTKQEAIRLIWAMHSTPEDNIHDMSRKVIKATYNGKPLIAFENEHEKNVQIIG